MCTCTLRRGWSRCFRLWSTTSWPEHLLQQPVFTRLSPLVRHRCTHGHPISTQCFTDSERRPSADSCYLNSRRLQAAVKDRPRGELVQHPEDCIQSVLLKEAFLVGCVATAMVPTRGPVGADTSRELEGIARTSIPHCIATGHVRPPHVKPLRMWTYTTLRGSKPRIRREAL